jgi:hypothetical protein
LLSLKNITVHPGRQAGQASIVALFCSAWPGQTLMLCAGLISSPFKQVHKGGSADNAAPTTGHLSP